MAAEYPEKWHNGMCLRRETNGASSGLAYVRNLDLSKFDDGSASSKWVGFMTSPSGQAVGQWDFIQEPIN